MEYSLRIAHFISNHSQYGGTERVASNLSKLFDGTGIHVPVVFSFSSTKTLPFYDYSSKTKFFEVDKNSTNLVNEINSICQQFMIDAIIFHGYHMLFFTPSLKDLQNLSAKIILITHFSSQNFLKINPKYPIYGHIAYNLKKSWEFHFWKKPYYLQQLTHILEHGQIVCVSQQCSLELREMFHSRPDLQKKIHYIYNPVVLDIEPVSNPVPNKENIVIYVSRLREKKKNSLLIVKTWAQIFRNNPTWKLLILGDGELKEKMVETVLRHKIERVTFCGVQKDVFSYFRHSQISLSSSNSDALPQALVEAACCGNALVTTAFDGGFREIVIDGCNGFVVPKNNYKKFAIKLDTLMNDEVLRKSMQRNSLAVSQKFNIEDITSKWMLLLNSIN